MVNINLLCETIKVGLRRIHAIFELTAQPQAEQAIVDDIPLFGLVDEIASARTHWPAG